MELLHIRKCYFFVFIIMVFVQGVAQEKDTLQLYEEAKHFQEKLNTDYATPESSPLQKEDLKTFSKLVFFEINTHYCVEAKFIRTQHEQAFVMQTTTNREPLYIKYGEAHFELDGKKHQLNIYQSQRLLTDPEHKDYLFIPFTDLTNGKETYEGGRYLDILIADTESDTITLDFNQVYNPYCAYNGKYSCPIPPKENNLKVAIKAGVKKFKK